MSFTTSNVFRRTIKISIAAISLFIMGNAYAEPPQRLIVQYKDSSTQSISGAITGNNIAQRIQQSHGVSIKHLRKMGLKDRHVLRLTKRKSFIQLNELMARMRQDPNILSVEEDALMKANLVPNDTFYDLQWHYHEATGGMDAQEAWDTHDGSGVVVAVVDTGYTNHSDLLANILPGYDFISDTSVSNDGDGRDNDPSDPGDWYAQNQCGFGVPGSNSSWHGTHVSGTIAAVTNNGQGVAGIAFGSKVVPVRVLGTCGGFLSDIADGVIWASGGSVPGVPANANPAQVLNMSLGGSGSCGSTYQNAINTANTNGTVVVVSAGNSNTNTSGSRPANCDNVINVAANDRQGNRASYSNYGALIDVTAPGGETATPANGVASTLNSGTTTPSTENYVYYQGTSMAAPHVAGTVALMFQADPGMTPSEAETLLKNTARPLPGSCSGGCGAGIIDARAALDAIGGGPSNLPPTSSFSYVATDLLVDFTDTSNDPDGTVVSWSWEFGDSNGSSGQNPSHTYAAAGTYTVFLTVTDNLGATDVSSQDVTVTSGGGGPTSDGYTITGINLASRAWGYYTIQVPEGAERLEVETSGGSGNVNLFVRFGANPTNRIYDCKDGGGGNNESCTITNPQAGTWHIGVKATRKGGSNVRLDAYWYDEG